MSSWLRCKASSTSILPAAHHLVRPPMTLGRCAMEGTLHLEITLDAETADDAEDADECNDRAPFFQKIVRRCCCSVHLRALRLQRPMSASPDTVARSSHHQLCPLTAFDLR